MYDFAEINCKETSLYNEMFQSRKSRLHLINRDVSDHAKCEKTIWNVCL